MKPSLSFDALTLHAVADELRTSILGAQVQKVVSVGPDALGLELYGRGGRANLLVSVASSAARVCLTEDRPVRASEAVTPLLLLLRKYVRDARLTGIEQPNLERVLELRFTKRDDAGEPGDVRLIIEAMGRRGNTVLVDRDGTILDALRRAGRDKNPARPILPHLRYVPPPAQDRLNPLALDTWDRLRAQARAEPHGKLAALLAGELSGFSPLLAREAAFRGAGRADATAGDADWSAVQAAVADLLAPIRGGAAWSPSLARWQGTPIAFAAYRLRHLEAECAVEDVASVSRAVHQAYAAHPTGSARPDAPTAGGQLARPLLEAIADRRALVERRRAALERSRAAAGDPDALRLAGETVLATAHTINPGQETVELADRVVDLDPTQSPIDNAQRYFREYRRARDAARRVPELLRQADLELRYLEEMQALVELADDPARIGALSEELRSGGVLKDRPPRTVKKGAKGGVAWPGPRPLTVSLGDGYVALVGTSARGNERVTFDLAGQQDLWLHARNLPGAHVIVRTNGREPPAPILAAAAGVAAYYSQGRSAGRVPVDWTLRKHVRKIRGGPPGLVSYVNERTIEVAPRPPLGLGPVAQ